MQLPYELKVKLEGLVQNVSINELKRESKELSAQYRVIGCQGVKPLSSDRQRLAYLSVRMPATYATLIQVLEESVKRIPSLIVESFLDIGAGPGTGLWAIDQFFSNGLKKATLVERDPGFIRLGKELAVGKSWEGIDLSWVASDVREAVLPPHDLVLASFSLGELQESDWQQVLTSMWKGTQKILIIVEPGTPKGFERMRLMRKQLLEQHAHLVAPCPHSQTCPMQGSDWCHFSARVERSSVHRHLKEATLNYEDEKFCYLIFSKEKIEPVQSRILTHPQKNSGYVNLKLCSAEGIRQKTVTRKSKEDYRRARKAEWGDNF